MASDIILKDDAALNDFHIELVANRLTLKQPKKRTADIVLRSSGSSQKLIMGKTSFTRTDIRIRDKFGESILSGHALLTKRVKTKTLVSETAEISELQISSIVRERLKPGKIKVIGKNGKPSMTLDGETGAMHFANGTTPMFFLQESGTTNPDRVIFAHSKRHPKFGLLYRDRGDKMIFQSSRGPVLTADLGAVKVGVGTDKPQHMLHVNGEVAGRGAFKSLSDARCKQNITGIKNSMDKIMALEGINFNWKDNSFAGENPPKEKQYGFIAQKVEKILPEAVTQDSNGIRSMSYASMIPLLVEGIKEQQGTLLHRSKKINSLESENKNLQDRLNRLESKFNNFLTGLQTQANA